MRSGGGSSIFGNDEVLAAEGFVGYGLRLGPTSFDFRLFAMELPGTHGVDGVVG